MMIGSSSSRVAVATELPIHSQEMLAAFTGYDFVIGPTYLKHRAYAEFYIKQRDRGRYVILDNGAFEGELLEDEDLLKIAHELLPHEIVAPDVIGDRQATYDRVLAFLAHWKEGPSFDSEVLIQACPQGGDHEDWASSYCELGALGDINAMGISYVGHFEDNADRLPNYFGEVHAAERRRLSFLHYLIGNGLLWAGLPHHLLGLWSPAALRWYARYPFIRSIDTSFPILRAQMGLDMERSSSKPQCHLDYSSVFEPQSIRLAVDNIRFMQKECTR